MKKALVLFLAVLLVCFVGCAERAQDDPDSMKMSAEVNLPGTLKADDFFHMANSAIKNGENGESFSLDREAGDIFEVPVSKTEKQTLYLFQAEDLEIAVFADRESDCVVGVYVRSLFDDPMIETYMASFAGAFLSVLEPQEYEAMLLSALPSGEEGADGSGTASGRAWSIYYNENIINLLPAEEG